MLLETLLITIAFIAIAITALIAYIFFLLKLRKSVKPICSACHAELVCPNEQCQSRTEPKGKKGKKEEKLPAF